MLGRLGFAWALRGRGARDVGSLSTCGVDVVEWLNLGAATSHNLCLLDLEHAVDDDCVCVSQRDNSHVSAQLLAILLVLFIHVKHQLLCHVARHLVLIVKAGRDAQMKGFFRLFLTRAFFEPATLTSESQFHNIVLHTLRRIL